MRGSALGAFLPAMEDGRQNFLERLGCKRRCSMCSATTLSSFSIGTVKVRATSRCGAPSSRFVCRVSAIAQSKP
jgi:hypothetical protein